MTLIAAGCARHGIPPADQKPVNQPTLHTSRGTVITPEKLADRLGTTGYLLLGEGHTKSCDHMGQAMIVRALAKQGRRPVVGLEMVARDKQPVLDRWNRGDLSLQELEDLLDWKQRWGHPFALYRSIFEVCQTYKLPLAALNVPRRVVDVVRKQGLDGVSFKDRLYIPDSIIPATRRQRQALQPMLAMHAQMSGNKDADADREAFFLIQSLWDTAMAEAAVSWHRKTGHMVVVLAGAGHVENRWGIAARLQTLDPDASLISVMPARDKADMTPQQADYFYFCPSAGSSRLGLVLDIRDDMLVVRGVMPDSRAANAGFEPGDVLVLVGDRRITSALDLHKVALPAAKENRDLVFQVMRKGVQKKVVVRF
ncbi:hypothetical protein DPF_0630 [Desulfoplanes formicivorans]|uniref:PDZ domain-containing protein n=2 Tax=Desulfoplanes formicivorans TaxID=1592317 RepID=A0A194AFS2_9BACT|nr:hypothetical protein DPF_0630 [Desulfoplanes formicivorans]